MPRDRRGSGRAGSVRPGRGGSGGPHGSGGIQQGVGEGRNVRAGHRRGHEVPLGGRGRRETPYAEIRAHRETHARRARTRAGPERASSSRVIRQPQLVVVKEKGKGKAKRKSRDDNGRRSYLGSDVRGSQIYIEVRRPGIYRSSDSQGTSSASSSPPPSRLPRPRPPPLQSAPFIRHRQTNMPPQPPPSSPGPSIRNYPSGPLPFRVPDYRNPPSVPGGPPRSVSLRWQPERRGASSTTCLKSGKR
ncbi:hypothetical protein BDZ45DRAFT_740554 [Acephala macrosclerotiorum]|nr:hypothetical protein BDZ45DRAFT_740554 [Acephala macrosclerotiorum]